MEDEIKKEDPKEEDLLTKHKRERDEYLEGWKRAKADLLNYKKDEAKRFETVIKFGRESLIMELINVLDAFDLALVSIVGSSEIPSENGSQSKTQKGLYLIRGQLEDILKKNGLERIMVSVGNQFDPNLHEAIAAVESDKPSGTIIDEVEKGYLLNGKLIRPARVKVAK